MIELIYIAVIALFIFIVLIARLLGSRIESPEKRAGRMGERFATTIIREILREDYYNGVI